MTDLSILHVWFPELARINSDRIKSILDDNIECVFASASGSHIEAFIRRSNTSKH